MTLRDKALGILTLALWATALWLHTWRTRLKRRIRR